MTEEEVIVKIKDKIAAAIYNGEDWYQEWNENYSHNWRTASNFINEKIDKLLSEK